MTQFSGESVAGSVSPGWEPDGSVWGSVDRTEDRPGRLRPDVGPEPTDRVLYTRFDTTRLFVRLKPDGSVPEPVDRILDRVGRFLVRWPPGLALASLLQLLSILLQL